MLRHYALLGLLVFFISNCRAQDPTTTLNPNWNGDPNLCTVSPAPTPAPNPPPFPRFSPVAEFTIERVSVKSLLNTTLARTLSLYQHLYDYNANKLILVKNENGIIDVEYFYYDILKKSKYFAGSYCSVENITVDVDLDGTSAMRLSNGTAHIRPMNEYLLFSNERSNPPVTPVYLGKGIVRGIPVDRWQACNIDRQNYRTIRRIWSFAERGVNTPTGTVGEYAHPIQAEISGSSDFPNGTTVAEDDEYYNVLSYKQFIVESITELSPPKGVFCDSGSDQNLIPLSDVGAGWPNRFSVRVEASTSEGSEWQSFHLRYNSGRDGSNKRLRYDFMPPGAEDYMSVIHDYPNDLTYTIDRRLGSCQVSRGVDIPDVSPIRDPIRFFIKHEAKILFDSSEKRWEYNGLRPCRGNAIKCTILTTSIDNFPAIVDPDLGTASGENWAATNVEYAWSMHSLASGFFNRTRFDYPVTLYMKLFRLDNPNAPALGNIRTEDVEYEFYEMSRERHPQDFDVSTCYRSLGYEYLHLMFVLKVTRGSVDSNKLNRGELEGYTYFILRNRTEVSFSRLSDVEIEHERDTNEVTVFFTLLGRTPSPGSATGFADEITAATARDKLQQAIDRGDFNFDFTMEDNGTVQFTAQRGSLKSSKMYMSTHAVGRQNTSESYSGGAQAAGILVGLLIGLIVGVIVAVAIRKFRGEALPTAVTSMSNPINKIRFNASKAPSAGSSNA